jgi:hypothetical protein
MDPNYLHEYNPRRKDGACKTIVGGRNATICGGLPEDVRHVRFLIRQQAEAGRRPFFEFNVSIDEEYDGYVSVRILDGAADEDARQFIEDAIREKLERL